MKSSARCGTLEVGAAQSVYCGRLRPGVYSRQRRRIVSANQASRPVLQSWLGAASFLPLVLLLIALNGTSLVFEFLAPIAIASSLFLSLWFCVIGFKQGFRWMLIWLFTFVLLFPFANIVFWLVHRRTLAPQ